MTMEMPATRNCCTDSSLKVMLKQQTELTIFQLELNDMLKTMYTQF